MTAASDQVQVTILGPTPEPRWKRIHWVLGILALVLAGACLLVMLVPAAVPGSSAAERAADRDRAVTTAARAATSAFLDVNYKDMDPRITKVLEMSTGTFKKQYKAAKVSLKAAAQEAKAVASGKVRQIGIGDVDDDSAMVFVAADSTVTNTEMAAAKKAGKDVDDQRYYRFQLSLSKKDGHWLLNDLKFVS